MGGGGGSYIMDNKIDKVLITQVICSFLAFLASSNLIITIGTDMENILGAVNTEWNEST